MASLSTSSAPTFTSFYSIVPQGSVIEQETSEISTISKFVRIKPSNANFFTKLDICIQCSRTTTIAELALFILNRVKQIDKIGDENINVSDCSFEFSPIITDLNSTVDSHNKTSFLEFRFIEKLTVSTFEILKDQSKKEQDLMISEDLIPMPKWTDIVNTIINAESHLENLRKSRTNTLNITRYGELMSKIDSSITSLSDVIPRPSEVRELTSNIENLSKLLRLPLQKLSVCLKNEYMWVKIQPVLEAASVSYLSSVLIPLITDYLNGDILLDVREISYSPVAANKAFTINYGASK